MQMYIFQTFLNSAKIRFEQIKKITSSLDRVTQHHKHVSSSQASL